VTRSEPLDRIRGVRIRRIPVGERLADAATRVVEARVDSPIGRLVRRLAGFPRRPIPMYWYRGIPNFGDALAPVIVEHFSKGTPVPVSPRYRGKLLAAGSVMHRLAEGDSVWGSGAIQERPITPPPNVRFHAVRGPLTRELIRADVPEVYGDPAILLPTFFTPRAEKRYELGLVPHFTDRDAVRVVDPSISTIEVGSDWREVVEAITACHAILSSSLHGLIVAEAYGVPAAWMTITNKVKGGGFKFRDYYLATGREPPEPLSWDGALKAAADRLTEPPPLDPEPLLRAWPKELTPGSDADDED
jgi:pyruvyltransferase